MRKFFMVVAVGALALLVAAPATALEFKFGAEYRVRFYDYSNVGFDSRAGTNPRGVQLRVRPIFDTSDDNGNITARLRLEFGDTQFGAGGGANGVAFGANQFGQTITGYSLAPTGARTGPSSGGSIGADGVAVEVKSAYIDFAMPFGVPLRVRSGIMPWYLPKGLIVDDDVAGVQAYGSIKPVSYQVGWYRASREAIAGTAGFGKDNALDFYEAKLDVAVAKVFNPGIYYVYGDNRANCAGFSAATFIPNCGTQERVRPQHWIGLTVTGDLGFLSYDLDWIYGTAKGGPNGTLTVNGAANGEAIRVRGWVIDGGIHIPIGPVRLNLVGGYATGDNQDGSNRSGAFPGGPAPGWSGPSNVAGGNYELIGGGGTFDVVDVTQDGPTNLWTLGASIQYNPVKALTLRGHYLYAGFTRNHGNCSLVRAGSVGCFGPRYANLAGDNSLGHEVGLRADYQIWTGFAIQGFVGWLFPGSADPATVGKYILQMRYNF